MQIFLIDIDGTLTMEYSVNHSDGLQPFEFMCNLVAGHLQCSVEEAEKRIRAAGNPGTTCSFQLLERLNVPTDPLWNFLREYYHLRLDIPEDTVEMLSFLKERNKRVYTATTNSRKTALVKLSLGGLADSNGSPWITGFFGGDSFDPMLGKFAPDFFQNILKAGGFDPAQTVMLGNEMEHDARPALNAGIACAVLIDRTQARDFYQDGKIIHIQSYRALRENFPDLF